jgi:hypothetical protein
VGIISRFLSPILSWGEKSFVRKAVREEYANETCRHYSNGYFPVS